MNHLNNLTIGDTLGLLIMFLMIAFCLYLLVESFCSYFYQLWLDTRPSYSYRRRSRR